MGAASLHHAASHALIGDILNQADAGQRSLRLCASARTSLLVRAEARRRGS